MLRALIVIMLLAGGASAQNAARPSLDEQLASAGQLLETGRTSEYERRLRQLIPKPEEEPIQDSQMLSPTGVHYVPWALLGASYLGANDYADAERVVGESLHAAEVRGETGAAYPVQMFLSLMAEVYKVQGKHAAAFPLYARLLSLNGQLSADFQLRTELGYVECLIIRGEIATAEMVSRPPVDPDGSYVGPSFHEGIFNTHAVAMEEAGHKAEAAELEAKIDAESRRTAPANQQDRDLLRARLLSARKQDAAAEAIYRKWTGYWKSSNVPGIIDTKESLQIRTAALTGYGHFLSVRGRSREALAIQSQLTAMGCRFGMCE
jgi:hypothetical protein